MNTSRGETMARPTAASLREALDGSLRPADFLAACLEQARTLRGSTDDTSALLFPAMAALGKSARGTVVRDAFAALFAELERPQLAERVQAGDYTVADLAFYWSVADAVVAPLLQPSEIEPDRVFRTAEHERPMARSIMHGRWEEEPFHDVDKVPAAIRARHWSLYDLEDVTYLYDLGELLVLDADGRPVVEVCTKNHRNLFFSDGFGAHVRRSVDHGDGPEDIDRLDEAVMVQDLIRPANYCHWLLDQLPRLRELTDSQQLVMYRLAPFMRDMLETLGISSERVYETGDCAIVRIGKLRAESSMGAHFHHPCQDMNADLVSFVRETVTKAYRPETADAPSRNVYLSRNKFDRRRISNEDELLASLERYDFVTVYPEELSMREQIALFRDASVIVSPHGASLANTIFCENVSIVEIFNQNYGTPTFYLMAHLLGFDYQHMIGRNPYLSDGERSVVGLGKLQAEDIEVDIERLERCLVQIFESPAGRLDAA